jgi:hypothetical protein
MQIHLPLNGLASFRRGVAGFVSSRDLKYSNRTPNIFIKTVFHAPIFPTMQDPDYAVGEENSFVDPTSPTNATAETSAPLTAAIAPHAAPGAPAIDEATKKAVDNVLYSDVRT